jgi:crotonobetainyl-CoA:carnitine CoA-transferase CaiB-like acyl-CoA transferase
MNKDPAPLEGVRVLDLTRLFPGPLATMMLGDLGAEVIKVEDPKTGDLTRYWPPQKNGVGAGYLALNRSKLSFTVNLKDPKGRALFLRLAKQSDVVVESFRPGVIDRLGIGYPELKQARDDIILCSISGYGQDGPFRERAGHDINYCARAGVLGLTGARNGPPMMPGVQIGDVTGGTWQALAGILGALFQRERTGQGQWLDIAMTEGVLTTATLMLAEAFIGEKIPPRGEAPLARGYPGYGVFETADGRHLSVGALEPHFFDALCEALGLPEHKGKSNLLNQEGLVLREEIARVLKSRTRQEWMNVFEKVEACVEPVLEGNEVLSEPQLNHRGMFFEMNHPTAGPIKLMSTPLKLANRSTPRLPPPRLGEHTADILQNLGLSNAEIQSLTEAGTVGVSR